MLADPASVLHAILRRNPDGSAATIGGPLIPLLDTTLLTNAPGEPTLWSQLRSEIESADAIDVVMAFIRRSGIRPLLDALRRHCEAGKPLRVLTTTYTGLDRAPGARSARRPRCRGSHLLRPRARLACTPRPGCSIGTPASRPPTSARRTSRTRRRSPAWSGTFGRRRLAIPTSSPSSAPCSRATGPAATSCRTTRSSSTASGTAPGAPIAARTSSSARSSCGRIRSRSGCSSCIELSRQRGHHRNLLVAATGTGKTVMAALDYATLREPARPVSPAVHRPPRGDPRPEPRHVPLRAARRLVRREVGRRRATDTVRARLRLDPEPPRQRPRRACRRITSTS